jgi:hypothetical protein
MKRRPVVPLLILGLLGVLSVGAVVLGLKWSPPTSDLLVHNGAGELTYATHLTALYSNQSTQQHIRVVYTAPDHVTESLLSGGPGSPPKRTVHVKGAQAARALGPFVTIQKVTGFTAKGPDFVASEPASSLYRNLPEALRAKVSGTVTYQVTLNGGYMINMLESFNVHTPVGSQTGSYQYKITTINGQPAGH